jgi:glycosyltransferase involved in cell wall biosynthesis
MIRKKKSRPTLVLVVYAKRNIRDMAERAFRSISNQTRKPDKLLVIDDSSEAGFDDVKERVLDIRLDKCHVQVMRNERTPGLCGAMNTAILKVMEYADETQTYISFLREEDEILDNHCQEVLKSSRNSKSSLILSNFNIKSKKSPIIMAESDVPSIHLRTLYGLNLDNASCLMAAIAVRLDAILEAGMFNEALRGMQIHELLLRISELPNRIWTPTRKITLNAPPSGYNKHESLDGQIIDRSHELTSSVILDMRRGSRTFCLLAQNRLDKVTEDSLHKSIAKRIKLRDKGMSQWRWGIKYDLKPQNKLKLPLPKISAKTKKNLASKFIVVGLISRSNQDEEKSGLPGLLKDLEWLAKDLGGIHVEILDNAKIGDESYTWFKSLNGKRGKLNINVYKSKHSTSDSTTKGFHLSIARARREIQQRVAFIVKKSKSNPIAWFLDEDLSLVNRAMCWSDDECRQWFIFQLAALFEDIDKDTAYAPAMILGQVTDAPPIPGPMTYRLQLLDAVTAIRRLCKSNHDDTYYYRDFQRVLQKWVSPGREIRDFYYDVSSRDFMHLEFPFDFFPWDNGEFKNSRLTNRDVLQKILIELPKLTKGKQVFRPIFADRHFAVAPENLHEDGFSQRALNQKLVHVPSVLRGGNTLLPIAADSDKYPTITLKGLKYRGKTLTPRRADMISAVICRYLHGKKVTACALPVRQKREDEGNKDPSELLNPLKYTADTEGFAIYSALKSVLDKRQLDRLDTKRGRNAKEKCNFTEVDFKQFLEYVADYRRIRTRAIIASFYRVRGLAKLLDAELVKLKPLMISENNLTDWSKAYEFTKKLIHSLEDIKFDCEPETNKKILSSGFKSVIYKEKDINYFLKDLKKFTRS